MENETFPTLEVFQEEIARLKAIEQQKKQTGEHHNATLLLANEKVLTSKDQAIYEKLRQGKLSVEEFSKYREGIPQRAVGRLYFMGFIANQLQEQTLRSGLKRDPLSHESVVGSVERDPELQRLAEEGAPDTKKAEERIIEILRPKSQEPK